MQIIIIDKYNLNNYNVAEDTTTCHISGFCWGPLTQDTGCV